MATTVDLLRKIATNGKNNFNKKQATKSLSIYNIDNSSSHKPPYYKSHDHIQLTEVSLELL